MIVVRLYGGLGNQFFQYAAARRLAEEHKAKLVFDTNWYRYTKKGTTPRLYELSKYSVAGRCATASEARFFPLYGSRILRRLPLPRPWLQYRECAYRFDENVLNLPDNVYLDGYWQSQKYFKDISDIIRRELTPTTHPSEDDIDLIHAITNSNAVSVHVRRGDYVTSKNASQTHGTCTPDYYRKAIERILSRVHEPHFFVFSDDPLWVRSNLKLPSQATYVSHNTPDTGLQDMRLMSMCRHHVIANSSFSWWGAWLNANPEKQVVAPQHWFASGPDTTDLIPAEWECI